MYIIYIALQFLTKLKWLLTSVGWDHQIVYPSQFAPCQTCIIHLPWLRNASGYVLAQSFLKAQSYN